MNYGVIKSIKTFLTIISKAHISIIVLK